MPTTNPSAKTQNVISSCHLHVTAPIKAPLSLCCVTLGYLFGFPLWELNELLFVKWSTVSITEGAPLSAFQINKTCLAHRTSFLTALVPLQSIQNTAASWSFESPGQSVQLLLCTSRSGSHHSPLAQSRTATLSHGTVPMGCLPLLVPPSD